MIRIMNIFSVILSVVLLVTGGIYLHNAFLKGRYLCNSIFPENISVQGSRVMIDGMTGNSALTYRGYEYYFENNNLYIKLRYGIHSKNYPHSKFNIDINEADVTKVENIYFTNGKSKKPVWSTKYTIKSTMENDRKKFEEAEKILLERLEYLALENKSQLRVCYEYSVISNDEKDTYMLLPIQRLSDSTIISNYLLNTRTLEIYEGDFNIEEMEMVFGRKIN